MWIRWNLCNWSCHPWLDGLTEYIWCWTYLWSTCCRPFDGVRCCRRMDWIVFISLASKASCCSWNHCAFGWTHWCWQLLRILESVSSGSTLHPRMLLIHNAEPGYDLCQLFLTTFRDFRNGPTWASSSWQPLCCARLALEWAGSSDWAALVICSRWLCPATHLLPLHFKSRIIMIREWWEWIVNQRRYISLIIQSN